MMTKRFLMMAAIAVMLTTAITGCGRKGALESPPDVDPKYPRTYPAPDGKADEPRADLITTNLSRIA
ncbi:MAG: lipoprotein [Rhodospirillales bacterium]|nr:lipoprotein [Rhodospirillales bacterium]MCW8952041.1 lipoprotein [Rhodospirillales bacterium]MCW9002190.1 lipoprotein [Rhodospirillales bacterium]